MKQQKTFGIILTFCVLLLSLAGCTPSFEGNSVKNADCYELDIEAMNGTDLHSLELKTGDTLQIQFETEKGSLYMEIKAPDGTEVYTGNGRETTEFTLNAPMDGVYPIVVEGQKAKGRIRVAVEKAHELTAEELAGPWHLAVGENDESTINESFPGAMEFGNSMEITENGNISWYIGAEGGTGTYTLDGDILHAELTSDLDGSAMTLDLKVEREEENLLLIMETKDLSLRWSRGEGETGKGEENASRRYNFIWKL